MADQITVKPPPESKPSSTGPGDQNQSVSFGASQLVILCAVGLGISFFLPWAQVMGLNMSGFDIQKAGNEQRLLWAIPILSVITILAGITKKSQNAAVLVTGAFPFLVGLYWYHELGNEMFQILTYGAYLSLLFSAGLLALSRKLK